MRGSNSESSAVWLASHQRVNPRWSLVLPALSLTAMLMAPPERTMLSGVLGAVLYTLMQYLVPQCRLRRDNIYSPLNVAMLLLLLKVVVVPILIMVDQPAIGVLPELPSLSSMEWASLIDLFALVGFCLGLGFISSRPVKAQSKALLATLSTIPTRGIVLGFAAIGLAGFVLNFGTPGRLLAYFQNPSAKDDLNQVLEGTMSGFLGTVLRPFVAISLVAVWSRQVDLPQGIHHNWKRIAVGILSAIGILIANLTFDFNRAAFVFPLVAMLAVYSSRVKHISPMFTMSVAAAVIPVLISIAAYRGAPVPGANPSARSNTLLASLSEVSEHVQTYTGGPTLTGFYYEKTGWGESLLKGSSLIASVMSPIPILGKGFRTSSGPAVFNRAIYGNAGFEDQIIPFSTELFANFHVIGVAAGFFGVGLLLGGIQRWLDNITSTFGAFALQYAGMWTAMLTVWSLSVYSQILFYFFGPFYAYVAFHWLRGWIRSLNRPRVLVPVLRQEVIQ